MVVMGILRRFLPVHDISTDYNQPPQFLKGRQTNPQLVPLLKVFYADVVPLTLATADSSTVYAVALDAAKAMPLWEVVAEEAGSTFQAVATTKVMKFKDDIVVRVAAVDGKVVVDTRSRSRVGQGDIGANGARILQYQRKLSTLLAEKQISKL